MTDATPPTPRAPTSRRGTIHRLVARLRAALAWRRSAAAQRWSWFADAVVGLAGLLGAATAVVLAIEPARSVREAIPGGLVLAVVVALLLSVATLWMFLDLIAVPKDRRDAQRYLPLIVRITGATSLARWIEAMIDTDGGASSHTPLAARRLLRVGRAGSGPCSSCSPSPR